MICIGLYLLAAGLLEFLLIHWYRALDYSSRLVVAWFDCWVGIYWDRQKQRLYLFPLPFIGVVVDFGIRRSGEVTTRIGDTGQPKEDL